MQALDARLPCRSRVPPIASRACPTHDLMAEVPCPAKFVGSTTDHPMRFTLFMVVLVGLCARPFAVEREFDAGFMPYAGLRCAWNGSFTPVVREGFVDATPPTVVFFFVLVDTARVASQPGLHCRYQSRSSCAFFPA